MNKFFRVISGTIALPLISIGLFIEKDLNKRYPKFIIKLCRRLTNFYDGKNL